MRTEEIKLSGGDTVNAVFFRDNDNWFAVCMYVRQAEDEMWTLFHRTTEAIFAQTPEPGEQAQWLPLFTRIVDELEMMDVDWSTDKPDELVGSRGFKSAHKYIERLRNDGEIVIHEQY